MYKENKIENYREKAVCTKRKKTSVYYTMDSNKEVVTVTVVAAAVAMN